MLSNLFRQLIASMGIAWRTIRAFFMRWIVGFGARAKRLTSASRLAAKSVPKAMGAVAVAGQKPTKREDYIETGRLYIAKSLIVILVVGIIVLALLFYFLLWPRLQSAFFTRHMYQQDEAVAAYSGRVILYYDREKDQPAFQGRLKEGLAQGAGKEFDLDGLLIFSGNYVDGQREGAGKEYEAGALIYEGDFLAGQRSGLGSEYRDGELRYQGDFALGLYEGSGSLYRNGDIVYKGSFSAGEKSGQGVEYDRNGAMLYKGEFFADLYDGRGTLYGADEAERYVGDFSRGKFHGEGTLYLENQQTLVGSFENGTPLDEVSILHKGKLAYTGAVLNEKPEGFGQFFSLDSGKLLYEGPVRGGMPDLAALLALSQEEGYALFGEAAVYEERNGEGNFSLVNDALGLTLLFPLRTAAAEPQVLSALLYEGADQSYLTINPPIAERNEPALAAWIAAMSPEGTEYLSKDSGSASLPLGTTPLRSMNYERSRFVFADYALMVWSKTSGEVVLIGCAQLGGTSSGGGSTGEDASDQMSKRTDALLAGLEKVSSGGATSQNAYYGSHDPAALFDDAALTLTEKAKIMQSAFDYFEAAEKRAVYDGKRSILQTELEGARERYRLGGDEAANVSALESQLSAVDMQLSQCAVDMEKAQLVAQSLTGLSLKSYNVRQTVFVLDPAKLSLDALAAAAGGNSVDVKLEVLNLELCYQQILNAEADYAKKQAELDSLRERFALGQATGAQHASAQLALADSCLLLYGAIGDYVQQLTTLNRMTGGYLSAQYGWLPRAFEDTVPPPAPEPPAEEAPPVTEPPEAETPPVQGEEAA